MFIVVAYAFLSIFQLIKFLKNPRLKLHFEERYLILRKFFYSQFGFSAEEMKQRIRIY